MGTDRQRQQPLALFYYSEAIQAPGTAEDLLMNLCVAPLPVAQKPAHA
jgi:hypothetical protein